MNHNSQKLLRRWRLRMADQDGQKSGNPPGRNLTMQDKVKLLKVRDKFARRFGSGLVIIYLMKGFLGENL